MEKSRKAMSINDWAVSTDLTDAYLHIRIHPQSREYLRFAYEDQILQFTAFQFCHANKYRHELSCLFWASSRYCFPRQTTLTSPSNVSSVGLETTYFTSRSSHHDQWHDSVAFTMVDEQTNRFAVGTSIHPPDPNIFLFTDASHYGWGAHLEPMRLSFHGRWTEDQSRLHINMLEMVDICLALKQAITFIHHSCIMICTDNTTVVSYINKQGGTHSPNICVEVWVILNFCQEHDIVIRVRHIPG